MSHIELKFGSPEHGWLSVELSINGWRQELDVSDVPGDSLCMLATAALDLAARRDEARVEWFLEPVEATWAFRRVGDRVEVEVRTTSKAMAPVRLDAGTAEEVCLVIWRALRRLESDPVWTRADADRVWSHPFPHREVAQLGAALGRGPGARSS